MNVNFLKTACIACALCAAAVSLHCAGGDPGEAQKGEAALDLSDQRHQASYVIGRNFGSEQREIDDYADFDIVLMAAREAYGGAPARLSDSAVAAIDSRVKHETREIKRRKRKVIEDANFAAATAFLEANKAKEGVIETESGLQYIVLQEGKGPKPTVANRVRVHYHGTLTDGTVFDSSIGRDEPPLFNVTGVILGWTEALQLMSVGSKFRIFVPPELAYGRSGMARGPIGPNMVLIFDIELVEIVGIGGSAASTK